MEEPVTGDAVLRAVAGHQYRVMEPGLRRPGLIFARALDEFFDTLGVPSSALTIGAMLEVAWIAGLLIHFEGDPVSNRAIWDKLFEAALADAARTAAAMRQDG